MTEGASHTFIGPQESQSIQSLPSVAFHFDSRTKYEAWRKLTPARRRVFRLLGEGNNPAEIAAITGTSLATVKTHLKYLYRKVAVTDIYYMNNGKAVQTAILAKRVEGIQREPIPLSARLTQKEKIILQLAQEGKSASQMAAKLDVTLNTVKTHLKNLYAKTGTDSLLKLAVRTYKERVGPSAANSCTCG